MTRRPTLTAAKVDAEPTEHKATPPPPGSLERKAADRVFADEQETKKRIEAREKSLQASPAPVAPKQVSAQSQRVPGAKSAAADPCDPVGTEIWYAKYFPGEVVRPPTHNSPGTITVTVRNVGRQSWPAGKSYLGYHLFDANGNPKPGDYPKTPVGRQLDPGQQQRVEAAVGALDPGHWRLAWDIWIDGVGWFSQNGVCALTVEYVLQNQPPSITLQWPPNEGTVTTRTPSLSAIGFDSDDWPSGAVTFQFVICKNPQFIQQCHTSPWLNDGGYAVPTGVLDWNQTFYWSARINDGQAITDPIAMGLGGNKVTVVVPAPDIWRTVGAGLGMATVRNIVLPYGIWVHPEKDAVITGTGQPVQVQRTYSSGAPEDHVGAFRHGWMSMFDASAQWSRDSSTLTITYPDGRQEIFGKTANGELVSRIDSGATNRIQYGPDGFVVKTSSQEVLRYDPAGRLKSIETTGVGSMRFEHDQGGLVSRVIQQPSGRALTVAWKRTNTCGKSLPPMVSDIATEPCACRKPHPSWSGRVTNTNSARRIRSGINTAG
jgi:hypothetical protein